MPRSLSLAAVIAAVIAVASTIAPAGSAAGSTKSEGSAAPAAPSTAIRDQIEQRLRNAQLDPARFVLEPLADWPQDRLRLVAANPTKDKTAYAPLFAVLPGDTVVMAGDRDGFRTLVAKAFPAPQPVDAALVAELAVRFGAYGRPVGVFVSNLPAAQADRKLPRADAQPVMTRHGHVITIDHYAYDFDRQHLFDCHLVLGPSGVVKASCKRAN